MEAVPRLPSLLFSLKTSPEGTSFSSLKKYIAECYQEDPETFSKEIHALETLRNAAMRPSKDVTGCDTLKRYYCQLHSLVNRFPHLIERNCFTFTWKDLHGSAVVEVSDLRYEMAAVLFNIAALNSQLGASVDRTDADGMKLACTLFQRSAWAFGELRAKYSGGNSPNNPDFATSELLIFMHQVSYAQAQECILEKSLIDNRKSAIVAKVTAQIISYYNAAFSALLFGENDGTIAEVVGSTVLKEWRKYVKFKISYLSSILFLYQGQQAEEQKKMGERVTLFQAAWEKLEEAKKESKGLPMQKEIQDSLIFTSDVIEAKLKAAKSENEFIYHEAVPDISDIAAVQGANLVNGIGFSVTDPEIAGEDIFSRLVPMKAHEASSLYSEEKAQLLRRIGSKIEEKDSELATFMSSLNVDYLNINEEKTTKIPQGIVDRCAALNAKTNAIPDLIASMSNLADICTDVETNLKEIKELLTEEDINEKQFQQTSGVHRSNAHVNELSRECTKYLEAHQKAGDSNDTLRRAMELHVNNLRILAKPLQEIQSSVPRLSSDVNDSVFRDLKLVLNKVNEMKAQREHFHTEIRSAVNSDDITTKIIAWGDEKNIKDLFKQEIGKFDKAAALIEQNLSAQGNILSALTEAYAKYAPILKTMAEAKHKKEQFFSSLAASYDVYEDLMGKSAKGLEFYRKLQGNVQKLLARVRAARDVQNEERLQRLRSVKAAKSADVTSTSINSSSGSYRSTGQPRLKDYLNKQGKVITNNSEPTYIPPIRPNPLGSEDPATSGCVTTATSAYPPQYMHSDPPPPYSVQAPQYALDTTGYTNPVYQNAPSYAQTYPQYPQDQQINTLYQNPLQQSSSSSSLNYQQPQSYSGVPQTGQASQYQYPNLPAQYPVMSQSAVDPTLTNSSHYQQTLSYPSKYPPPSQQQNNFQSTYSTPSESYDSAVSYQNTPSNYQQTNYGQTGQAAVAYQPTASATAPQVATSVTVVEQTPRTLTETINQMANMSLQSGSFQPNLSSYADNNQHQQLPTAADPNNAYSMAYQTVNYPPVQGQTVGSGAVATTQAQFIQSHVQPTSQPTDFINSRQHMNPSYSTHPGYMWNNLTGDYQYASGYQTDPNTTPQMMYTQYSNPISEDASKTTDSANMSTAGQSFANQYAQPQTLSVDSQQSNYYTQPYGYQTHQNIQTFAVNQANNTGVPSQEAFGANNGQTYIQSNSNSSVTNTTLSGPQGVTIQPTTQQQFDQNQVNHSQAPPIALEQKPAKPISVPKPAEKKSSNLDLLSDIDFVISTPLIQPQQIASPVSDNQSVKSVPVQPQTINNDEPLKVLASSGIPTPKSSISPAKIPTEADIDIQKIFTKTHERNPSLDNLSIGSDLSSLDPNFDFDSISVLNDGYSSPHQTVTRKPSGKESHIPSIDHKGLKYFHNDVERYEKSVDSLNTKMLNGSTPLATKWKELQDLLAKDETKCSTSIAKLFPEKNRSADSIPYDHARVVLEQTTDNYINAAFVKGLGTGCPPFILAQTPLQNTVTDFWSMIWSQKSRIVVCLHTPNEILDPYWPQELNKSVHYDDFSVKLVKQNDLSNCIEFTLKLSMHGADAILDLSLLQIKTWKKNYAPQILGVAENILTAYKEKIQEFKTNAPLLMNCLTGSERSGLVALAICAILATETSRPVLINVVDVWYRICSQRKSALRDANNLELSMQIVLSHGHDLLNKSGIMTSYQMKNAQVATAAVKEEIKDPLAELDPLWKMKQKK